MGYKKVDRKRKNHPCRWGSDDTAFVVIFIFGVVWFILRFRGCIG